MQVQRMEPALWSVKHHPHDWDSFYGQDDAIAQLRGFISGGTIPNLILHGPPGTGKSAAIQIFAKEILGDSLESNFKILNIRELRTYSIAKAKRNIQALAKLDRSERTELDEYMSIVFREAKTSLKLKGRKRDPNKSQLLHQAINLFASTITVTDELVKILVLDEADALDRNMQQALRRTMEVYSDACRFVLITPTLAGWNPAIISRCLVVKFPTPSLTIIETLISEIASKEQVVIDERAVSAIARESLGDLRFAINLLQISSSSGRSVSEDDIYAVSEKTITRIVREMISLAFDGKHVNARKKLRLLLTYENYAPGEVILEIERDLLKRPMAHAQLSVILDRVSEIDLRITQAKNPFIHLTALLASIANLEV